MRFHNSLWGKWYIHGGHDEFENPHKNHYVWWKIQPASRNEDEGKGKRDQRHKAHLLNFSQDQFQSFMPHYLLHLNLPIFKWNSLFLKRVLLNSSIISRTIVLLIDFKPLPW